MILLMILLGMFNTTNGCLKGSDDHGNTFAKHTKLRQLMSFLSLFQCKVVQQLVPRLTMMELPRIFLWVFTAVVGFACLLAWISCRRNVPRHVHDVDQTEPETENFTDSFQQTCRCSEILHGDCDLGFAVENFLFFERCLRLCNSTNDGRRAALYAMCVNIVH